MLIHSADIMETIETAGQFCIHAKVERIDWQSIIRRVAGRYQRSSPTSLRADYQFV
jgi:pyruvate/2-oxoglutarate dehydrogenase complex dihydrolipoamide dehydrogenase (E3) component